LVLVRKIGFWGSGKGPAWCERDKTCSGVGLLKKIPVEEAGGVALGVGTLADDFWEMGFGYRLPWSEVGIDGSSDPLDFWDSAMVASFSLEKFWLEVCESFSFFWEGELWDWISSGSSILGRDWLLGSLDPAWDDFFEDLPDRSSGGVGTSFGAMVTIFPKEFLDWIEGWDPRPGWDSDSRVRGCFCGVNGVWAVIIGGTL
jgi:hypothetical protein